MVNYRIPRPYTVAVTRTGPEEYDEWGDPVTTTTTETVPAAGWAAPNDEAKATVESAGFVEYRLDLYAEANRIDVGDRVTVDGSTLEVLARANYDRGPFGFTPGLDVLKLGRTLG